MNKVSYVYLKTVIAVVALTLTAGCATNSSTNPASTGAAALGGMNSSQQAMDAGAAIADTAGASQIGLVDILVHRLGVSPQQALGGAGAIFQSAKGSMDPQAFSSLSRSIPGMSSMLGAAPSLSGAGGLSSVMGSDSSVGSAAALAGSFKQLNLSPDMVGRFIPVITNYVKQNSGSATADLLQSALGGR